jgi:hypothetical protein
MFITVLSSINDCLWERGIIYANISEYIKNTASNVSVLFFWVVTPCGLLGRNRHFGRTYYLTCEISGSHGDEYEV